MWPDIYDKLGLIANIDTNPLNLGSNGSKYAF